MKKISHAFLFGALILILLAACSGQQASPTAAGTNAVGNLTASPAALETQTLTTGAQASPSEEATIGDLTATITIPTATDTTQLAGTGTTQNAGVPVTGPDLTLLEGQFCIQNIAHALLVLPDTATYEVLTQTATLSTPEPDMGCHTVDTFNGRQIVLCRSQENTSLNLNICTDGNNCQQFLVNLQSCPLLQNSTPQANLTNTPGADGSANTNTPAVTLPTNTPAGGASTTPFAIPTATP